MASSWMAETTLSSINDSLTFEPQKVFTALNKCLALTADRSELSTWNLAGCISLHNVSSVEAY